MPKLLRQRLVNGNEETWPNLRAYREAAENSLKDLRQLTHGPGGDGPTLFCVARNEADIFPEFLSHYRRLGVNRFVIVDHGSFDETQTILRSQPDVELYWTAQSYRQNNLGRLWIDGLIRQTAANRWVLTTDVDEQLVYQGCAEHPIPDLIQHLERQHLSRLFAPMIDLYEIEKGCLYFDAAAEVIQKWEGGCDVRGGPRYRKAVELGLSTLPCLSKYPLVFYDDETAFANCHFPLPHHINGSECLGRLLHTKLVGRFAEKVTRAVIEGQYWQNGIEYRGYMEWMGSDLRAACSKPYSDPDDLVGAGLMKSIDWTPESRLKRLARTCNALIRRRTDLSKLSGSHRPRQ